MKLINLLNPLYIFKYRRFIRTEVSLLSEQLLRNIGVSELCFSKNRKKLLALKNIHQGKRCFIIGNGPSLKISDLEKIKDEITFASNKIYLAFDQMDFRPTYYTVVDPFRAFDNQDEIRQVKSSIRLFPKNLFYLFGDSSDTIYFNFEEKKTKKTYPRFSEDAFLSIHQGFTVTYANIQLAYYMGIREVYLIGMDFDYTILKVNNNAAISVGEQNHFIPNYRKTGEIWSIPPMDLQKQAYVLARNIFEEEGGNIYNATRGGKLEIFIRKNFDGLLA